MNKNNIPIIKPKWGTAIDLDKENRIIRIHSDQKDFYKMSREDQIDELEFILQSLREMPKNREMAKKATKRLVGMKKLGT